MLIYSLLFIYIYIYIYVCVCVCVFWNINLFRFVKIIVVRMTNVDVKLYFEQLLKL